jgi:hypothetical protein
VFHGILGLGVLQLQHPNQRRVNAMDFIWAVEKSGAFIPTKRGLDVQLDRRNQARTRDPFVAEMGQWGMPADRKVVVFGKDTRSWTCPS